MPRFDEPWLEPCACVALDPEPRLSLEVVEPPEDEPPEPALLLIPEDPPDEPELLPPALPPGMLELWASAAVPISAAASPSAMIFMGRHLGSVGTVTGERRFNAEVPRNRLNRPGGLLNDKS